jgi:PleD family two-component response regulator
MGVAEGTASWQSPDKVLNATDEALQAAKKVGRNKVSMSV